MGRPPVGGPPGGGPPFYGAPSYLPPSRRRRRRPWTPAQGQAGLALLAVLLIGVVTWAAVSSGATSRHTKGDSTSKGSRGAKGPGSTTTTTTPSLASQKIATTMQTFTDPTRNAVLNTEIIYPVTASLAPVKGRHPLIVFAEGFEAVPDYYTDLLDTWAKAGFVVAAPIFPDTSAETPPAQLDEGDDAYEPAEVSFLITSLIKLDRSSGNPLSGLLDPSAIGLAGHSDGGDVVSAVSYNKCCYDSRIGATAILSGAELSGLDESSYFTTPNPSPLLIVQGQDDDVNSPTESSLLYTADTNGSKYYLSMTYGTHWTPYTADPNALTLFTGASLTQGLVDMAVDETPVVEKVTTDFFESELMPDSKVTPAQIEAAGTVSDTSAIMEANLGS